MSLPSKSVPSKPVPSRSTPSKSVAPEAEYFHACAARSVSVNRSPEQTFGIPLFPEYVRSRPTPQPPMEEQAAAQAEGSVRARGTNHDTDVDKLLQQYGELSHLVQEQTRMQQQQQQQMNQQAEQHHRELCDLKQDWNDRLETVIANTQKTGHQPAATRQPMHSPAFQAVDYQPQPQTSHSRPANRQPSPLQEVSTTYRVKRRAQARWIERFLSAVPALVGLVVAGTIIAALSAIALSPTVLWPSLSLIIQTVIPFIFVTGLISVGITAVWDAAR